MLDPQEGITTESIDFAALKASIRQQLQPFHEDSAATFEETDLASSESDVEQVRPGDPVFGSSLLAPKTSLESSLFIKNAIHKLKALDESLFAGLGAVSSIHNLMALCIGLTQLDTRSDASISAIIEKAVLKWLQRVCALPELKHVHFHGSTDFSAGILPAQEIQVYRTATFLCMGPNPDRITSASIPVFYFPSTLTESDPSHPEKLIKKYWALIGTPSHSPTAKIRRIPSTGPSTETLDVSLLIAYLSEDVAVGRRPCVVYCRALSSSASLLGEWDDLGKIREACSRFGAWMHVECDNMSLLTAPSMTDDADTRRKLESLRVADSITFHASEAFKLERAADLPSITLFNTVDPRLVDPLHMEAFDTLLEKPTALQAASQRRRSSGSAGGALIGSVLRTTGSSGGERMSSEYQFPDFGGSSGGIGMSRSGSVSSVASNGGVVRAVSPNSSRLLKRMSSNALFHAACFSGENSEALVPVGLKYSLPWWLWSMGTWTGELMDSFQLGQELTEKLADRLESGPDLSVFSNPASTNYLTVLFHFNPTVSAKDTLLTHPVPPVHVSHVPEKPQSFIPKPPQMPVAINSPWTPGFGTAESLMQLEQSRRESWANKMNADLGTRFLFDKLSNELKTSLQLELVSFNGSTFIRYQTMSYLSSSRESHVHLVDLLVAQATVLSASINSTLKHQKKLQSVVAGLNGNSGLQPLSHELRYIPPSQVSQWKAHGEQHQEVFIGLGGLHFTPSYLDLEAEPIDEGVVKDLDALNECLVESLATEGGENDTWGSVFSKGVIGKGWMGSGVQKGGVGKVRSCIRIGILKDSYDDSKLETLVDIVLKKGRELERGDQFLATLSDVIKRGIHNAEINLKKQSHDDEVSMFRSLPVIGTVLGFMGVLPSASGSSEAIVSEEPEQTAAGDDSDVASLIEAKVYGAVSSEDMSGPRRPASNVGAHHPRAVARSFTLSSGFSTVPIEEERIVKVSPPALASVSQVESFVTERTETDVDGEGEGEEILMEDLEGDRGGDEDNEVEDDNEYSGKLELEEQESGYVGNGELVVGMVDDEGYTAENEEEEEFVEDEEDV